MHKRTLIKLAIGVALAALIFALFDIPSRDLFSKVKNEMESIKRDSIAPSGGVAWQPGSYSIGNGLLNSSDCGPNVNCPRIIEEWIVPVQEGKESEFAASILEKLGYQNITNSCPLAKQSSCDVGGTKNAFRTNITVSTINQAQKQEKDVSPLVWRQVKIAIDYYQDYR